MKKFGRVLKKIEKINGDEKIEYGKDFKKSKFNSDDNLPLNRLLRFHNINILLDLFLVKMVNFILNYF